MEFEEMLIRVGEILHESIQRYKREAIGGSSVSDITINKLVYLEAIHNMDQPTLSTIAARLRVSKASASASVSRLVELGLVTRNQVDDDQRVQRLGLSEAGSELIAAEAKAFHNFAEGITRVLTEDEVAALRTILAKIISTSGR